ncbi:MAG: 50S ribosomal protein L3 [Candidatus Pelagibacter sp.]|nr:50S ribosomal protein L3 [Candidatus Pelagibacter sp.]
MRSGLIAEKIGMTQLFEENGSQVPVTVLKVLPCTVLEHRTHDVHGYDAIQVGACEVEPRKVAKPQRAYFEAKNVKPMKIMKEFRVAADQKPELGALIDASHFNEIQYVDVTGRTIGKGFAGVMKRHNFGGLRASHGVSVSHRSHGSTGNRQDPGKVFKNKKMAGHMGDVKVTKLNLKLHKVDVENNLLYIKGSVPGAKHAIVFVRDAIKKQNKKG